MTPRIVKLIAEIDEFKGYWKGMSALSANFLSNLRILATIESIGSSTRIEGAKLSDSEVSALLKGIERRSFRSRDQQEVAGYAEALQLIQKSYDEIDLTENNMKYLHKVLLKFSDKDAWHLGEYKKHPNHVAAFDADGREIGILFETASPFDTPQMMESLVSDTIKNLKDADTHPLPAMADFIVRFLAIHPFQDGNGRLSRVLTNLLLLRSGYAYVQYSSHESIVEANKDKYYSALRTAQKGLKSGEKSPEIWTTFFLEMLKDQKDHLLKKIEREKIAHALPDVSIQILNLAKEHGRITVSFVTSVLQVNRNTVKKHLQHLVRAEKLVLHGKGRGSYYSPFTKGY
jgi:Fic family protein